MRTFRLVSAQAAELLEQHAAKSTSRGEIDLNTQIEIARIAAQIRQIGREKTKELEKNPQQETPKRQYRKRNQVDDNQVLVS